MRFCLCLSGARHYHKSTICFLILAWTMVQLLTSCGALVRTLVNTQACTFATLQKKKALSEHKDTWNTYTSGSESKKNAKEVVRASLDLSVLYTIPLYKTCTFKRSPAVGDFGRHQNACLVHEIIRLPYRIHFFFVFFHIFLMSHMKTLFVQGGAHTGWQQKRVPEEGEVWKWAASFTFYMRFRRPPRATPSPTRFRQPDRCALTGRISLGLRGL